MRYTGSKNKIARRENADLNLKTLGSKSHSSLLRKLAITPGQHGGKRRRKVSERGRQLREKQKLRFLFGISETQLSNYFARAIRTKGNTADNLLTLLERRLDNIVYRLGMAPTRAAARQLVNHGHVTVNTKSVSIPSYQVHEQDEISFKRDTTAKIPAVESSMSRPDYIMPEWLDRKGSIGKMVQTPDSEDVSRQVSMRLVIEFYSK